MEKTKKNEQTFLADNIVSLRTALGYRSAESFAEHAGLPYPTLRDIEAGISAGRPATIQKIASALGCTMDDLYKMPIGLKNKKDDSESELLRLYRQSDDVAKNSILETARRLSMPQKSRAVKRG